MPRPLAPVAPDGDRTRRQIVERLQSDVPGLMLIYLFGSVAGGTAHGGSDLDVAFLADAPLPAMARFTVQEDLGHALRYEAVDLVDLRTASTVMSAAVLRTGQVLFERDRSERDRFEMHACSAYALLNEERRGILEDIQHRGSVYKNRPERTATDAK